MSGHDIGITMMAIEVITTAEADGVENCGKPASTKKSWASKGWAIAADTASFAGRCFVAGLDVARIDGQRTLKIAASLGHVFRRRSFVHPSGTLEIKVHRIRM